MKLAKCERVVTVNRAALRTEAGAALAQAAYAAEAEAAAGTIVDDSSGSEDLSRASENSEHSLSRYQEFLIPVPGAAA